jgi:hypothetical protein
MPRKQTISPVQLQVLKTLKEGGRMLVYITGDCFLDTKDETADWFKPETMRILKEAELIKIVERPAIGTHIYGLSQKGIEVLKKSA